MIELAAVIDVDALFKVALYSVVAGVGMTTVISLAIVGVAKADDERREGKPRMAVAYTVMAVVATLVALAGVVQAIIIMTTK